MCLFQPKQTRDIVMLIDDVVFDFKITISDKSVLPNFVWIMYKYLIH